MIGTLKAIGVGTLLVATAALANAAPGNVGQLSQNVTSDHIEVQRRFDRSCRRGPGGWYRYNRFGERRPCRTWDGRGRRPDACVKFGPIWYCDY